VTEPEEILHEFTKMLQAPTGDGQLKRRDGKPFWKIDTDHEEAMLRHLHRWDRGELVDEDSGAHPLVHVAWRALALAFQETQPEGVELALRHAQERRSDAWPR
jgi:hypothetical protein